MTYVSVMRHDEKLNCLSFCELQIYYFVKNNPNCSTYDIEKNISNGTLLISIRQMWRVISKLRINGLISTARKEKRNIYLIR